MKRTKKALSVFLSLVMIFSCFSAAFITADAASGTQLQAMHDKFIQDGVGDTGNYTLTQSVSGGVSEWKTVATVNNNIYNAAEAYYAALNSTIAMNNRGTYNSAVANNTAKKAGTTLYTALQSYFTTQEWSDYNLSTVLDYYIGGVQVSAKNVDNAGKLMQDTSNTYNPTSKVNTVFVASRDANGALMSYASLSDVPNTVVTSKTYTVMHDWYSQSVTTGSGCNAKTETYEWHYATSYTAADTATTDVTALKAALNGYVDYFTPAMLATDLGAMTYEQLSDLLDEASSKASAINSVTEEVRQHFSLPGTTAVNNFIARIQFMVDIVSYRPYINYYNDTAIPTDLDTMTLDELIALRTESTANFEILDVLRTDVSKAEAYNELKTNGGLDFDAIDAWRNELQNKIEIMQITILKNTIDAAIVSNGTLTELSDTALDVQIGAFRGYIDVLNSMRTSNVNIVFTEGVAYVTDYLNSLVYEANYRAVELVYASYVEYFTAKFNENLADVTSEDIMTDRIPSAESKKGEFDVSYADVLNTITAADRDIIFGDFPEEITDYIDSLYAELNTRITAEVDFAYAIYTKTGVINLANFSQLKNAIDMLESDVFDFLTPKGIMSAETIARYNELKSIILDEYNDFIQSGGFAGFEQIFVDYPTRYPTEDDKAREGDKDKYEVTDEKLLNVIKELDEFLTGDEFSSLVGLDGSLSDLLNSKINGIFTNDIVNTIVQYVYPLVADEFINIWDTGLPSTAWVDNSDLQNGGTNVNLYFYTVESATQAMGLYLFPTTMASGVANIQTDYPDVYTALMAATTAASATANPWTDASVCDAETGKLTLDWGVTDYESFVAAMSTALKGLEPLLLALLSNKDAALTTGDDSIGHGDGTGKANILSLTVNITITKLALNLNASGSSGYNDALVPIFEALGVTNCPDGDTFESTEDIVRGIFEPVFDFIDTFGAAPVDTLAAALPTLSYAISVGLVTNLLSMIKTDINYSADATYSAVVLGGLINVSSGTMYDAYKADTPISINIGQMINLADMGLDISSLDAVINMVLGLLKIEDVTLPHAAGEKLAALGELTTRDSSRVTPVYGLEAGKSYYIEADKSAVLYSVVKYVLTAAAQDPELISKIVSSFDDPENPSETLPSTLNTINTIVGNATKNIDYSIAAVVELVNPQHYATPKMTYANMSEADVSQSLASVGYSKYWTRDMALYVDENLDSFIDELFLFLGLEPLENSLNELMSGSVYTNQILAKLCGLLGGLIGGLDESTLNTVFTIVGLCKAGGEEVNIDDVNNLVTFLETCPEDYDFGFADGDRDGFLAALIELLKPVYPVLKFFVANADLTLLDLGGSYGGDGYKYGIVPILEALGCDSADIMTEEQYYAAIAANEDNMVLAIVEPVLKLLDKVFVNPAAEIMNILPNIVYFIDMGGLNQSLDIILHPLYVVLDTVRPVYSVNLNLEFNLTEVIAKALSELSIEGFKMPYFEDLKSFIVGTPTYYTSINGEKAIYVTADRADFITMLLRFAIETISYSDNIDALKALLEEQGISDSVKETLYKILDEFASFSNIENGEDQIMMTLYYIFFGLDVAVKNSNSFLTDLNNQIKFVFKLLAISDAPELVVMGGEAAEFLDKYFDNIFTSDGLASNGVIPFFQSIINFFKKLIDTLSGIFA